MHRAANPIHAGFQRTPSAQGRERDFSCWEEHPQTRTENGPRRARDHAAVSSLSLVIAVFIASLPGSAQADAYGITHPGQHIDYVFELEPEVILRFDRPFRDGPGLGVRASVPILFNGFISTINNSVAITFGFDKDPFSTGKNYYVPVGLQWNFWLHRNFSVFGEPGVLFASTDRTHAYPQLWGGARVHFTDFLALTGRISLPSSPGVGLGVSFFL